MKYPMLKKKFFLWGVAFLCSTSLSARINLQQIKDHQLETSPYQWAMIDHLFDLQEAMDLAATYPCDLYKTVDGYDGEKGYQYEVRSLIPMGKNKIFSPETLSPSWHQLAQDLISDEYRMAISELTGIDLSTAPIEINVFHYGQGAWMGPHVDLKDKIVTHVLYFNSDWDIKDGGCLAILNSKNVEDTAYLIPPLVGNSALLVRSNCSWHSVLPISPRSKTSRRCITVTFYHPQSISTMWPPKEKANLHTYPSSGSNTRQ